jgi:hypothetical protein
MSRSYRRPYSAITGIKSAADDKRIARRSWRRAQEQAIRDCADWEELVIPLRLEAAFNDVWSWGRDGHQSLQFPPQPPKDDSEFERQWFEMRTKWYAKIQRK